MDRRKFLTDSLVAGGIGSAMLGTACGRDGTGSPAAAVHTGQRVTWRLASSFPRSLDTIFGGAEVLAERVEALSGGMFRIRVHPTGEIVPGLQVMDAVQQGTVHVGHTASYYFLGKNPALAFETCVPFGLTSRQQTAWLTQGGGLELLREVFSDFGIVNFPAGNTGTQMGGWFKQEIAGVEDLQGLRMRIPGLGGKVMSRLGASVQVLAGGDIFPALERGTIDATEWVGPYDDEKLGFHKVANYYYYPGWWEAGPSLSYHVNLDAWNKLPVTYQEIFRSAASESATYMQARYDSLNPPALTRLLDQGVQLKAFSHDLLTAAHRASEEMLDEEAAKDETYRRILDSWRKVRLESYRWFRTAELSYSQFALGSV